MLQTRFFSRAGVLACATLMLGLTSSIVRAEDPKFVEKFNDWGVYTYTAGGGQVCFILSEPKSSEPKGPIATTSFFLCSIAPKMV
jgi:hypothetical protein